MTEMFGEAWSPMSVPDLAPDDDDDDSPVKLSLVQGLYDRSGGLNILMKQKNHVVLQGRGFL